MIEVYRVVIRTACRSCALAIAGRVPALGTIKGDDVYHDGSALACPEHGKALDLSREPER